MRIAIDNETGRPLCMLLQAAMKGDYSRLYEIPTRHWVTMPPRSVAMLVIDDDEIHRYVQDLNTKYPASKNERTPMKFEISKSTLSRMLSEVSSVVERKKSVYRVLTNVKIVVTESHVEVYGTNQILSYAARCNIGVGGPPEQESWLVDAHSASKLVGLLPEGLLDVWTNKAMTHIHVQVKNVDAEEIELRLQCWGAREFPELPSRPEVAGPDVDALALAELIAMTKVSMGRNPNFEHQNGILLSCKDGTAMSVGTDGVRLIRYFKDIQWLVVDPPVLIPEEGVRAVERFLGEGGSVRVCMSKEHIFFSRTIAVENGKSLDLCLSVRYLEGFHFKAYEHVIPQDLPAKITLNTAAFLTAIEQSETMTLKQDETVVLEVDPVEAHGSFMLETSNPDVGASRIRVKYTDPVGTEEKRQVRMGCNLRLVSEIVAAMRCESIEFAFAGPLQAFTIRPEGSTDLLAVMMPSRLP